MMNKFIDENPEYGKNLRRRMYDVLNVLSSVDVLQKKGLLIKRKENSFTHSNQMKTYCWFSFTYNHTLYFTSKFYSTYDGPNTHTLSHLVKFVQIS